jgi:hypothetical protein
MLRILVVLFFPATGLAAGLAVMDAGPLFGGPRAFGVVGLHGYPRGQEVLMEIHATSDLPGAEKVFLGQSKTVVARPGAKFIDLTQIANLVSDPLPSTQKAWKLQLWYSPKPGDAADTTLFEHTVPRKRPVPKK